MEQPKNKYNVLYVDDEINNLNSFRAALRRYYNILQQSVVRKESRSLQKMIFM